MSELVLIDNGTVQVCGNLRYSDECNFPLKGEFNSAQWIPLGFKCVRNLLHPVRANNFAFKLKREAKYLAKLSAIAECQI
ncbi:hypothetical protein DN752_19080 [Echinicola strongylocentroti]|uniref:Uncharacterized protein n=1 Tax=Echinicola strongylocentroti TaxID=1795355 RepID=A0A2Z4IN54_9BACT|nr:hypothetical protein DN752_19080 [Echinicola strongylocentroti]